MANLGHVVLLLPFGALLRDRGVGNTVLVMRPYFRGGATPILIYDDDVSQYFPAVTESVAKL